MLIREHYVPRFYLKHFARHKKPKTYIIRCFDKVREKSFDTNIINIAMEKGFYDKSLPQKIEPLLAYIESESSKIYNQIIKKESIDWLTDKDRTIFSFFLFLQTVRTRSARELFSQIHKIIYNNSIKKENLPKSESFQQNLFEKFLEDRGYSAQIRVMFDPNEDLNESLKIPIEASKSIFNLEWNLTKNDLEREFYTSDHPIFILNPIKDGKTIQGYGLHAYQAPGVEIYFPLHPKMCLIIYDNKLSEYRFFDPKRWILKNELDWINTQIIAEAYRFIFTKNNDFQFVKKLLKENKELKDPKRNRVFFK